MVLQNAIFCDCNIAALLFLNAPLFPDVSCGAAPEIPNAYITSTQQERYLPGARVQYKCESNFQMMGGNYVTCTNGEWSKAPTCRGRNLCFHLACHHGGDCLPKYCKDFTFFTYVFFVYLQM